MKRGIDSTGFYELISEKPNGMQMPFLTIREEVYMFRKLKIRQARILVSLAATICLMQGCAPNVTKSFLSRPDLALKKDTAKIMLMPIDIQLSTLTAGSVLKPEAEWTANAAKYVEDCLKEKMRAMNVRLLYPEETARVKMSREDEEKKVQLLKLHEAVGFSILLHQYVPAYKLPGKKNFDWSLGPQAIFLKERFEADYALFVCLRDSYASAGRVAFFVVAAAFGVGIPMGQQVGFASLVDLETGDVVWFNRLGRGTGDLRTPGAAYESVELLLCDFPR